MSMRMGSNQRSSRANALDKRVPRNPRYADVKSKVETGMTVDKVTFITTRQHLRRQEEPYFRLTPSQLSELLSEYEQDQQEGIQDFIDHIDPDNHGPKVVEYEPEDKPSYDRPYLILDVRPPEDFRGCRILQARSFESKLLNQDRMTPELYMYKNREGGLIVLYSNDDAEACHAARILINRGFDNVFVLSGGLVAFVRGGFHSFVEGDVGTLPPAVPAQNSGGGSGGRGGALRGGGGGSCGGSFRSSVPPGGSGAGSCNGGRGRVGGGNSNSNSSASLGGGGRLEYRNRGGQSVVVRGSGGGGIGSTTGSTTGSSGSKIGSLGGGSTLASARRGHGPQSTFSTQTARAGVGRGFGSYPGGRGGGGGEAAAPSHSWRNGVGGGGGGVRDDLPQKNGLQEGCRGGGLAEAAVAASAARRRSLRGGGAAAPAADMSKGSSITVADSVISRSTARRGRW